PPFPLDVCSAESQGFIGYMLDQSLKNRLQRLGLHYHVVSMLTQTQVAKDDPAFQDPSKPIGVFYSEEEAKQLAEKRNWVVKEDAGRGWRRVVASPMPQSILGSGVIQTLTETNAIVIASGGGGIPVVQNEDGTYQGIEAVIDKDRSGFKLAVEVKAETFMILTDIPNAYINRGRPDEKALGAITLEEAKQYVKEGHFSAGSMAPKMEAAISFAEHGGKAIICSLEQAELAMAGEAGTRITGEKLTRVNRMSFLLGGRAEILETRAVISEVERYIRNACDHLEKPSGNARNSRDNFTHPHLESSVSLPKSIL